ncbi:MAG: hypothetical protein JST00_13795 [Deltaproteobacteria bacterium]|nr:hypothetical protein [Deltaproteobacteria bacterium]
MRRSTSLRHALAFAFAAVALGGGTARAEAPPNGDDAAKIEGAPRTTYGGYVHADWVVARQSSQNELDPSTGEPLNEDRFVLRRARLKLETDQGLVHGALMVDVNTIRGPQVRPWNAEVTLKWPPEMPYKGAAQVTQSSSDHPFFLVSTGLLMTPFGFEVPELESDRPFLERSTFANELFPQSYDLGLRVLGGYKFVNYAFAIMNGDPIGDKTFPGRDPNKSKDLVFRVGASSEVFPGLRLDAGFSGVTGRGFHRGTSATKDQISWRDENGDGVVDTQELAVLPGSPATPSEGFQRFALGADARAHVDVPVLGELTLRAEIVRAKNLDRGLFAADPVAATRDLRELGFSVSGSQELTRWSMIGVRFDSYDPDADASEQLPFVRVPRDLTRKTWAFMAMARYKKARLVAEYDRRTNRLGREASGQPATLDDDSFTLRAVVGF